MPTDDRSKSLLRTRMRRVLAGMSQESRHEASQAACRRLVDLAAFRSASVVMLYMPLADEVDVTPVALRCFQTGKTVCVPKVDWEREDMEAVEVLAFDDHVMEVDEHGLRTPRDGAPVVPTTIDLVVVPGLAFDTAGFRLGRGGGYYDRFLGRLRRSATTVGVGFDSQLVEQVPAGDGDVAVGMIVTDQRVCRAGRPR
ncbi:MAG: 5-formyltetrahydrofolate cyclo-ligase [Planctomycetota bacterium]